VRLNRFLSLCGLGSRRGVEAIIAEGQVAINGSFTRSLGTVVADDDEVRVNGRIVRPAKGVVLALNKPKGYVCSRGDTHDRLTIYDLLPVKYQNLHHVGRLDKESEGLLLMTNRGDLSHRLMHPSQGVEKEYEVVVDKPLDPEVHFPKLVKGFMTPEGFAKAERVWAAGSEYRLHLVLKQGLKRQIRHMLYFMGFEVERLIRVRIGWLSVKGLTKGGWKELTEPEVKRFFSEAKPTPIAAAPAKARTSDDPVEPRPSRPSSKSKPASKRVSKAPAKSSSTARSQGREREDGRKRTAASESRSEREAPTQPKTRAFPNPKSKFDSKTRAPSSRSSGTARSGSGKSEGFSKSKSKSRPTIGRKPAAGGNSRGPAGKKTGGSGKRPGRDKH
jgi:23S rRNA pseudouridine2605 synthase